MSRLLALLLAVASLAAGEPPWQPVQGTRPWSGQLHAQHKREAAQAAAGAGLELVFLGDSITAYWSRHPEAWRTATAGHRAANFGIPSDRTQEMLWRIGDGVFAGLAPRVIVVMAGTNNLIAGDRSEDIVHGVRAVIAALHAACPGSRILLLGVLPYGRTPSPGRGRVAEVNRGLAGLADGTAVRFLDFGARLIAADGTISEAMLGDGVHPGEEGYRAWNEAMGPVLAEMLRD